MFIKTSTYISSIFLLSSFIFLTFNIQAQGITRIRGIILDAETNEPLPFVNASFVGTTIGAVSNTDGKFYIETEDATISLKASFIGYEPKMISILLGSSQQITILLRQSSTQLDDVTIESKKLRYKNKGNPAVTLIGKVLKNKERNQPQLYDFYEYDKYEKVEFDFNNISQKFMDKRYMRDFQLIFDYMDTSEVNGKAYLPIFLRETSSKVYYRKDQKKEIEYRYGHKMTGFSDYFDNQGISSMIDKMYQDVNIYDNNVDVLTQKFVSPISLWGPNTYKYYIADTIVVDDEKLFKLSFQPRNENNLAFVGNLYITTDSAYAVKKASFSLSNKANLNYVEDLFIDQEFERTENGSYVLMTDKINIDFSILSENGIGMYGKRSVSYRDRIYNVERNEQTYSGLTQTVDDPNMNNQSEEFWEKARHTGLTRSEQGVFNMVKEVKELPAFKRMMDILTLLMIGYQDMGKVEMGPISTFASWNKVEGFRLRLGGRTTPKLSDKWQFELYGAYGFNDKDYKYGGVITRFLTKNPMNAIRATYKKEIQNPGEDLEFAMEDNFLLSLKRGVNDKRIYSCKMQLEYLRELNHGFSYNIGVEKVNIEPGGILSFLPGENTRSDYIPKNERQTQSIRTFETNITLRFAPNEQYYQGSKYRVPIYNKHPVFTFKYDKGYKNVFSSDYSYDRLSLNIFKRTFVSPLGFFDLELEGKKLFGQVPYTLLNIARANQTYNYQIRSYNLMNFLEFVSDEYVSLQYAHYFNGFFLNKIPLIKKLKWRFIITFKGLMGRVSDLNDPALNPELPGFPNNIDGTRATYPLDGYAETSFGVANIFTFLRVDLVKRWTQLDRPDVDSGYSIRAKFKLEF